jgi:hypothetical protein
MILTIVSFFVCEPNLNVLDGPSIMVMIVVGYVSWMHFQDS